MKMGVDLSTIEDIVLSHGHWDHAGGFLMVLDLLKEQNPQYKVNVHTNPSMFHQRALQLNGELCPFKKVPGKNHIAICVACLIYA